MTVVAGPARDQPLHDLERLIEERAEGERRDQLLTLARALLRRSPEARLQTIGPERLYEAVCDLLAFVAQRREPLAVRVVDAPTGTSALQVNLPDAPFIVETVREAVAVQGHSVILLLHPVLGVERDSDGRLVRFGDPRTSPARESVMNFALDALLDPEQAAALTEVTRLALSDLQLSVADHSAMIETAHRATDAARAAATRYSEDEVDEAVSFLEWLTDGHFIFLGVRDYAILEGEGEEGQSIVAVPGSGLGILRDDTRTTFQSPVPLADLPPALRDQLSGGDLVIISKTNRSSVVKRRVRMDDIAIRKVDAQGRIVGQIRMLGLFTSLVYMQQAARTPILRRKLRRILQAEDLMAGSHDYKAAVAIFESFPRDELFQASADELRARVTAVLEVEYSKQVKVSVRIDPAGRNVSVLVAMARDRFNAALRRRLQALLVERYHGASSEYNLALGEAELAQLFFTIHVGDGGIPDVPFEQLEHDVVAATRSWDDEVSDLLAADDGEIAGRDLARRYAGRLPDYYKSSTRPELALMHLHQLEELRHGAPFSVALQNETAAHAAAGSRPLTRLTLAKPGDKVSLSSFLPILEDLGLEVVEEVPTRVVGDTGDGAFLHDFGVLAEGEVVDLERLGDPIADAVAAAWRGEVESDPLNALVTRAGVPWEDVAILRAYRRYRQKVSPTFTEAYQNDVLCHHAETAALLVELFHQRFRADGSAAQADALRAEITDRIDAVRSLDEDRILRGYLQLIEATVRTNAYLEDRPHLSFKLRSADVPGAPEPRPLFEIFVYSTEMEGIHLRGGMVARGGIRWSDRREDFRTEILGLMKAQMVKNAVIVPVGSKGGFVLRRTPDSRPELMEEVRRQYETLIRGLLDVTDNIVAGQVVHPDGVRVYDGDDPYLVVAADKGTAALSDVANGIAAEYGFWLGDAFASGGSHGYDHKAMGITARGAWESVKRHFRELGHDVATQPFTVVGVGDMSGDVFGNGMLLSQQIRLVGAFDHRHVFLDPSPDAAASYAERRRLFDRGVGTSWADYDPSLISPGGGVFPRSAKSVDVSPEAAAALGIEPGTMTPADLVRAVLRAPVDLFWNGGIGTFVKCSEESNTEVGDRTNDSIRVDARELRTRVVAEGGNLGFTQRGRIEYALGGGRINTDAIDNSAGVDTSDREVNLKILLDLAIERGVIEPERRDELLASVEDDVATAVLYDNYLQAQILSQSEAAADQRWDAYEDLMRELESEGLLNRSIEFLPTQEVLAERRRSGRPLTRPELAVLLAYAKRSLRDKIFDSTLPDDPWLDRELRRYFPAKLLEATGDLYREHRLRREIIATVVTNDVLNSLGVTWVTRLVTETGAEHADVVRAFWIARDVSHAVERWDEVEALFDDPRIDSALQMQLMEGVDWLVEVLARWYLQHSIGEDLSEVVKRDEPDFSELARSLRRLGSSEWRAERALRREAMVAQGVPSAVAEAAAWHPELSYAPDIIVASRSTGRPLTEAADAFFLLGERLGIDWLEGQVESLQAETKWQRWALGAITDDLRRVRREIAERVLALDDGDVRSAIDAFLESRADAIGRLTRTLAGLRAEGVPDVAAATVAVRQLRAALG